MAMSVEDLDRTVNTFYTSRGEAQKQAETTLNQFKENPDAWLLVDKILSDAKDPQTKFLGLQVLDGVIKTRWKILPRDQCQGIRNFTVSFIIDNSNSEEKLKANKTLLGKLNLVLVSILKQEWPHNWPTFINEICSSSYTNLSICENNMAILRLLSEEVFDFSADQLTSVKAKNLKNTMSGEFAQIYKLCTEVLGSANQASLLNATLDTLRTFLYWIPTGYMFETDIINTLKTRFFKAPEFRNGALKCFTEIAGVQLGPGSPYADKLVDMFTETLVAVSEIIPEGVDLRSTYPRSNNRDQEFVQNLALFLCAFFTNHLPLIENFPNPQILYHGHQYLLRISRIEDREIFKITLEYWTKLVQELYEEIQTIPVTDLNPLISMNVSGLSNGGAPHPTILNNYPLRKHKYNEILSRLRVVMIENMVRPEEVLIVENDEGEMVREIVKESDTIQLYSTSREVLVYLTHLDVVDTENIMSEKLSRQVDDSEWSWHACNTLCWAIGSISGAMNEETEKRFLVTVIKDLLGLTEAKRGKDNKAVVASNIMYIVGQYPRFLKAHWKFLKTVVNKLFEFMHESHEGVKDMACDTFIKIAQRCRRHFVVLQAGESEPFIDEIVRTMSKITNELDPPQVHTFYKACGFMISAQGQKNVQERLISDLMAIPNQAWDQIIASAQSAPEALQDADVIKIIGNIMKTNVAACSSIGSYFYPQIGRIYMDMLQMYKVTSGMISEAIARDGPVAPKTPKVRGLRTVKKEILKLIINYVDRADDIDMVNTNIVPPLLEAVLVDYNQNVPDARDAEVLNVMTAIITKLKTMMEDKIPMIMANVFQCTLEMINRDFSEYPEHRVEFFKLLKAINLFCFPALLNLDVGQMKLVIDSCMWASKHDNREVETTGLTMCSELIDNMAEQSYEVSNKFFSSFFVSILQDIFFVVTDSDHKAGFKVQCLLLSKMFWLVETGKIQGPVYQPSQAAQGTTNKEFLLQYVSTLLVNAFPNLQNAQVRAFAEGLFMYNSDQNAFKTHLRDFLISMKEFSGDNAELYQEDRDAAAAAVKTADLERQKKVGGLLKPVDLEADDEL